MCTEMRIDSEEFLQERRKAVEASIEYFRSGNIAERERWVAAEFIENLGVAVDKNDFSSPKDDPPDVCVLDARFEIKEILDAGRRRGDDYKDLLEKFENATKPDDVMSQFTPIDITPKEISSLVVDKLNSLKNKYEPKFQQTLDLLIYVNLLEHFVKEGEMPCST